MSNDRTKVIYWGAHPDRRGILLMAVKRIWIAAVCLVAGGILGPVINLLYHAATDEIFYVAHSEFYLDFAYDPTGQVYDHYNGYTWNDLMTTEPIAGHTLEYLRSGSIPELGTDDQGASGGYDELSGAALSGAYPDADISLLEKDSTAEILSDIRVLHLTVKDSDPELCAAVQKATEAALLTFGEEAKEFEKISLIKSEAPERQYADDRTLQAVLLGLIIGGLAGIFCVWFYSIMDDRVRFPADLAGITDEVPLLRVEFRHEDERLAERFDFKHITVIGSEVSGTVKKDSEAAGRVRIIDAGAFADMSESLKGLTRSDLEYRASDDASEDSETSINEIPGSENVLIRVPYARVNRSALILLLDRIRSEGGRAAGMIITDADNRDYKKYYFLTPKI